MVHIRIYSDMIKGNNTFIEGDTMLIIVQTIDSNFTNREK